MDGSTTNSTELYVKKVLAGSIEDVRNRLLAALESMDYDIIEEEPRIVARRSAKNWGDLVWFRGCIGISKDSYYQIQRA